MKIRFAKYFLSTILAVAAFGTAIAQDYVAVAKDGNVYDDANAKYITANQNNDDVAVIPGMVFVTTQHTPGWYKIEYSPGLHAFIPDQIAASNFKPVGEGSYVIKNNPSQKIDVKGSGDDWNASTNGKTFKGKKYEEILIFLDENNKVAYSLVDLGSGPIAITYDNTVTKFF